MSVSQLSENLSQPFHDAVRFLARHAVNGGIYGLKGSATAFLAAAAVRDGARTIVLILPDGEAAASTALDLRFYLGREEVSVHPLSEEVVHYPSSDVLPYSFGGFESDVWLGRMTALHRLCSASSPRVVVLGLDALVRKIIPKSVFQAKSFSVEVGQDIDRDSMIADLAAAGYSRSPLVEDAGDFSVRGFIIDVYSPLYPYPTRIEQMGDRVESIRFFDPANQRSREPLREVHICPVHMALTDERSREPGLKRLVTACEDRGVEKRVRQSLLDDFRHGVRFPGADHYLPYFVPCLESLFDYLPRDASIVVPHEDILARVFEDLLEEIYRGRESAGAEGLPVPEPEDLYLSPVEFQLRIRNFRNVTMSELESEKPNTVSYRLQCSSNRDIRTDLMKSTAYDSGMSGLVKRLSDWRDTGNEVFLVSHTQGQAHRLLKLLEPYALGVDFRGSPFDPSSLDSSPIPGIRLYIGPLAAGFRLPDARTIVLTEEEIFGSRVRTPPRKRARGALLTSLTDLVEGDAVVHEDYGIGIFRGLTYKEFEGVRGEVMVIEFAGGDLLYHPVERLQVIQKYVSGSEGPPRIDRLGGKGWLKTKNKVKRSIREMAKELLEIFAKRQVSERKPYAPTDESFAAFEAAFQFEETPDQARAIQDVMEAMDRDKPMDTLVCGDVGYGKTEVALRAAFRAMMDGKQVAILVPTTVLAQQHYDTITRRFRGYPFQVDVLSRFRSTARQKETISRLKSGKLDLVIGTHRLLAKDVEFRELGLLVVDEEHRFGVAHKEKIKQYKAQVDVLTLTATPIPRTLNLSLTGIRDLSLIETPPTNRRSIRTHVMRQSDEVIREALLRELNRGGQVFYLHNRVQTIARRCAALQQLVPEGRFAIAHGQMADTQLERVMVDFVAGRINVLVCTSIIESGLDIPTANTMVIERADTFGLADLYQLRGRVGRSNVRAYAYLLTPPETLMTPDAVKRLAVIQEHSDLGQGFRIAMRDMEIRGAGNILGTSQSGHVALVGYEMYMDLLEEAIQEIKGETPPSRIDPEIQLKIEALIPEDYVPEPQQRMNLYKKLSRASADSEIDEIQDEILDLYGKAPHQVNNLIQLMRIRTAMKEIRVLRLDYSEPHLVLSFDPETALSPELLVAWAQSDERVRLLPGDRLIYRIGDADTEARIDGCFQLLDFIRHSISPGEVATDVGRASRPDSWKGRVRGLKKR
ncbi:MAG: transcription-repair coupling factor [Desulfomonilaceae bacterium]|nr:transcription-repair coupling factor [Desulfomonilaceae bacterium]